MADYWNVKTIKARIKDFNRRTFHDATSPNEEELSVYKTFLNKLIPASEPGRNIVILGMTGGLRQLAHEMGYDVTCVDRDKNVIDFLKNWVPSKYTKRERHIPGDWMDLPNLLEKPANAILGDVIFANILSPAGHKKLLHSLKSSLAGDGAIIMRTLLIPKGFSPETHHAHRHIKAFRSGRISEAEFGFGIRIFGSYELAYDETSFLLSNNIIFNRYREWFNNGTLSEEEYSIINRYYFDGFNFIPPQDWWENILRNDGCQFRMKRLSGKCWYEYCPIYLIKGADGK